MRVETPLYRSTSDSSPVVLSPIPQRTIPLIKAPESPPPAKETKTESPGLQAIERSRHGWHNDNMLDVATIKAPRSASPRLQDSKPGLLTTEQSGFANQPFSIAKIRRSPFAHLHSTRGHCVRHGRKLGQLQDLKAQDEVCPDCIAELAIRNRERSDRVTRRRGVFDAATATASAGSTSARAGSASATTASVVSATTASTRKE